jgi:histone H3/H4
MEEDEVVDSEIPMEQDPPKKAKTPEKKEKSEKKAEKKEKVEKKTEKKEKSEKKPKESKSEKKSKTEKPKKDEKKVEKKTSAKPMKKADSKPKRVYRKYTDEVKSLRKPRIQEASRRAGCEQMSGNVVKFSQGVIGEYVDKLIHDSWQYAQNSKHRMISAKHVDYCLKENKSRVYSEDAQTVY